MMKSYFEIGGEVICNETPLPTALAVPQRVPLVEEKAGRSSEGNGQLQTRPSARHPVDYSIQPVSRPYTVGVGVGNPYIWAASNALIYSAGFAVSQEWWPNTTGEDRNVY